MVASPHNCVLCSEAQGLQASCSKARLMGLQPWADILLVIILTLSQLLPARGMLLTEPKRDS